MNELDGVSLEHLDAWHAVLMNRYLGEVEAEYVRGMGPDGTVEVGTVGCGLLIGGADVVVPFPADEPDAEMIEAVRELLSAAPGPGRELDVNRARAILWLTTTEPHCGPADLHPLKAAALGLVG